MIVTACWIVSPQFVDRAFDGEGAKRYGGRWNNKGVPLVYLADSLALAAMELLVHLESDQLLLTYRYITVEFDQRQVRTLAHSAIPDDWRDNPAPPSTRALGDRWFEKSDSLLLKVPSVVVPEHFNYLLNPAHDDFQTVRISKPKPFCLDSRLAR